MSIINYFYWVENFISDKDIPILKHLKNVSAEISNDNKNYKISLEFEPNEFFEETKLEKEFIYTDDAEDDAPSKTRSTTIKWKAG